MFHSFQAFQAVQTSELLAIVLCLLKAEIPLAVVHTDLYIGSLSILDMGQADKSCFPLVSQTESFLICLLRPCHAFCESSGHDKSYENVFLEESKVSYFFK